MRTRRRAGAGSACSTTAAGPGITWPKQFGGRGGTPSQAAIFAEEQSPLRRRRPARSPSPTAWSAPTLMVHGTDAAATATSTRCSAATRCGRSCSASRRRAATSPALGTRAVLDGDEWVVNGQKVWTSGAPVQRVRDPARPHRPRRAQARAASRTSSSTCASPGIEVRPLRQITGVAHFNEVFLTDVRIPAEQRRRRGQRRLEGGAHDAVERAGPHRRRQHRVDHRRS